MDKASQRKEMIRLLKNMDAKEHKQKSDAIIDFLLDDPVFKEAAVIGTTISAYPEVDTRRLLEKCWESGKKTAVPKCDPVTKVMTFRLVDDPVQLETVYMKLKEPIVELTEEVAPEQIDLLIVPGVLFSADGYRIGFGGGYYDRYLTRYNGPTRSLAFASQLVDAVPVEAHDLPVERICTENGCLDKGQVER
ncbi:5-formyltetrahydrofolate cyclo-ligase [Planococcus salinarum]|uniref:5-formyltetrahydrofolate cyclo-ligase n=1 Tax=Planococcus salinarum TaxID=622695 RepID=UPI000E3BA5CD|nr:5-formyltetrahydrofolate cyclo-ligase [Planococcus salinarum]TAA70658.1 5-formyltetrahydrofolate cyclo-ligase [Planococcus salinarum]